MELNVTEEEFEAKKRSFITKDLISLHEDDAIRALKELGITFKQEIDWEAESHDPSVIPDGWFVEAWDEGSTHMRVTVFFDKKHTRSYYHGGARSGYRYNNYRAIKKENWPKWAIERHKSLED